MTKKEFTDYLFKAMYELGYRKAEVAKGGVFFYKGDTLTTVWTPRVPTECTCFNDEWQCIHIGEYLGIVDWESVEVDTPIKVQCEDGVVLNRHFTKFENGDVFYYSGGRTSWSAIYTEKVSAKHAKLAEV